MSGRLGLVIALPALTGLASSCLPYPVYKTLQPPSTIVVRSAADQAPIAGAEVQLITDSYHSRTELSRHTVLTDVKGRADFESHREWRMDVMALHGEQLFRWTWCAKAAGYQTAWTTQNRQGRVPETQILVLQPGASTECGAGG